jgi:hypothetical protein
VTLQQNSFESRISIPGFKAYGCDGCHDGGALLDRAQNRLDAVLKKLRKNHPEISSVPLRQYIIQPWADELLHPNQFAHTTFDTIRIFPRTVLIDEKVYDRATHLHESLHLTQDFLGAANELEAYSLNIRSDPRFLLLNFPYFQEVVQVFFVSEFKTILDDYFFDPPSEGGEVPSQVKRFLTPLKAKIRERLAQAIKHMEPLLKEVSRINRKHPLQAAYLSEQTGTASLLLDLAAAKLLPPPEIAVSENVRKDALAIFAEQFDKNDNTRLGYFIDRKKEALMQLRYKMKINDPKERGGLYFYFLKQKFLDGDGELKLFIEDKEDFKAFVEKKLAGVEKMSGFERMTAVETEAAHRLIADIKKELSGGIEEPTPESSAKN